MECHPNCWNFGINIDYKSRKNISRQTVLKDGLSSKKDAWKLLWYFLFKIGWYRIKTQTRMVCTTRRFQLFFYRFWIVSSDNFFDFNCQMTCSHWLVLGLKARIDDSVQHRGEIACTTRGDNGFTQHVGKSSRVRIEALLYNLTNMYWNDLLFHYTILGYDNTIQ